MNTEVESGYRFAAVPEWVVFHPDLNGSDVRVFAALARFANKQRECWPGVEGLAEKLAMNIKTVRRSIAALEACAAIAVERERRDDDGRQLSNRYHLAGDRPLRERECPPGVPSLVPPGVPILVPEVEPQERNPITPPTPLRGASDLVQRVFETWLAESGRDPTKTKLSEKRGRLIRKAVKDYPLEDVLAALRGWKNSPWHRGENPGKHVYNELELLLRDSEHIERFRDLAVKPVAKNDGEIWNDWLEDYHRNRPSALTRDAG